MCCGAPQGVSVTCSSEGASNLESMGTPLFMVGLRQMIQEEVRVSGLDSVVGLYDVIGDH
jgi:hypothetical protein